MSKLLKRALKNSLTPGILMIAGKALGIFIVGAVYGFPMEIGNDLNGIFSTQIYFHSEEVTYFVNSASNLLMFLILLVPTVYLIVKTLVFQATLDDPRTIVKVAKFNMLKWITRDDTTFLKIFIWCIFLWLACVIIVKSSYEGDTYTWIAIISTIISLLVGFGALKAFEVEINKVYPNSRKYY